MSIPARTSANAIRMPDCQTANATMQRDCNLSRRAANSTNALAIGGVRCWLNSMRRPSPLQKSRMSGSVENIADSSWVGSRAAKSSGNHGTRSNSARMAGLCFLLGRAGGFASRTCTALRPRYSRLNCLPWFFVISSLSLRVPRLYWAGALSRC